MKYLIILLALFIVSCSTSNTNRVERCKASTHLFDDDCAFRSSHSKN